MGTEELTEAFKVPDLINNLGIVVKSDTTNFPEALAKDVGVPLSMVKEQQRREVSQVPGEGGLRR